MIYKGPKGSFDNFCANDEIIFQKHKRSIETNISKNSSFHGDERFWPIFPRIIERDTTRGTIDKDPQGFPTITVEVLKSFL